MRYAKLINNDLQFAPNPIRAGDNIIGNPPDDVYLAEGYKPVRFTQQPEPLGGGHYDAVWTETEDAIVQSWIWREAADEDEITDAEAMEILLGGESG